MRATEILKDEHEGIKLMLRVVEAICVKLDAGQDVDMGDLDHIAEFITVFTDKCHHSKEEELLFPALEAAGVPSQGGPIGVMLSEHETGRAHVRSIGGAVQRLKQGDRSAAAEITQSARSYAQLLTDHIDKENTVLYPMADTLLAPEKDDELVAAFETVERDRIGEGKHEEYHRLLDRLAARYLHES